MYKTGSFRNGIKIVLFKIIWAKKGKKISSLLFSFSYLKLWLTRVSSKGVSSHVDMLLIIEGKCLLFEWLDGNSIKKVIWVLFRCFNVFFQFQLWLNNIVKCRQEFGRACKKLLWVKHCFVVITALSHLLHSLHALTWKVSPVVGTVIFLSWKIRIFWNNFFSSGQENKVRVDTSQAGEGALSVNIRAAGQEVRHSIQVQNKKL